MGLVFLIVTSLNLIECRKETEVWAKYVNSPDLSEAALPLLLDDFKNPKCFPRTDFPWEGYNNRLH